MRTETFHTPGAVALDLRVPAGRVEITTAATEETQVVLRADPAVEEAVVVELRERDGAYEVVVDVEERRFLVFRSAPEVDVRITCPDGARLVLKVVSADARAEGVLAAARVNSVSGDVELPRVDGEAEIKTVSGDVRTGEIAGEATLQTVSGDLRAQRIGGAAELRTVSGDVRVEDAGSSVTAQTVSGDLELRAVSEGRVELRSVSGDMVVGVRAGSKLWVDARSATGDTSSDLPLGDAPADGEGPLVELHATAMSGDVRVVRAG